MAVPKKVLPVKAGMFQCIVCKCRRPDELLDKVYSNRTRKSFCTTCTKKFAVPHVPKIVSCEICREPYDIRVDGSRFLPHSTKLACAVCMDKYGKLPSRTDKAAVAAWFVLSCEPGSENTVRKKILKTAKQRGLKDKILRMFSPVHHVERLIPMMGEIVASGEGLRNPNDARAEVKQALWRLEADNPGVVYKGREFQDQKTGKWGWKVRVDLCEETLAIVQRRKYPGYMIVNMIYDKDTQDLFKRQGKCWGLLLQDYVAVGLKVSVSHLKSKNAWRWRVENVKKVVLAEGLIPDSVSYTKDDSGWVKKQTGPKTFVLVKDDKPKVREKVSNVGRTQAWEAGKRKAESIKTDRDLPTGLESEEAAIEVVAAHLVKEIEKDPVRKASLSTIPYKIGDTVVVKHGPWTGNKARVAVIDREPDNPEASVLVTMTVLGGAMVSLRFRHHQLTKESK